MHASLLLALIALATASPLSKRQRSDPAAYPAPDTRGPTPKPEWVATYEAAKAAGKIPSFAPSHLSNGAPAYGAGVDTGKNGVCSWTVSHCFGEGDVYQAPAGMYAASFDDGPLPNSPTLYRFLQARNQTATHFLIGSNILNNPSGFDLLVETGGHIGVHTWSHPYMTTLTDMQVLGELGWTAQIIKDMSGFAPSWWRPSYGDVDNRVRAIAQEVFGLKLAGWDVDSSDWCLSEGGGSSCGGTSISSQHELEAELRRWQTGAKNPGILGLEHELTSHSIQAFINTFDGIAQNGWDARCIPDLHGDTWYANAVRTEPPNPSFLIGMGPYGGMNNITTASSSSSAPETSSTMASPSSDSVPSASAAFTTAAPASPSHAADQHPSAQSQVATKTGSGSGSGAASLSPFRSVGVAVFVAGAVAFFA